MYDELIKRLRYLAKIYSICENENTQEYKLAVEAADAIEELANNSPKDDKMSEFHDFCDRVRDWMTGKIDPTSKRAEEMTQKELYRSWVELWWWLDHYCEREPPKWGDEDD